MMLRQTRAGAKRKPEILERRPLEIARNYGVEILDVIRGARKLGVYNERKGTIPDSQLETLLAHLGAVKPQELERARGRMDTVSARDIMLQQARRYRTPIEGKEWERERRVMGALYSIKEIMSEFGSWETFWKSANPECKIDVSNETDMEMRRYVMQLHDGGSDFDSMARSLELSLGAVKSYALDVGILPPDYIANNIKTVDALVFEHKFPVPDQKRFGGAKDKIRGLIAGRIRTSLSTRYIKYLGLPGPNFADYAEFYLDGIINPKSSMAVENDRVIANIMESIIKNCDSMQGSEIFTEGGKIFSGLNLFKGDVADAIDEASDRNMKFNVVFLDYQGGWSSGKERAVTDLFRKNVLDDDSVLFVTLNASDYESGRTERQRGFDNRDQFVLCDSVVKTASAISRYDSENIFEKEGGFVGYESERGAKMIVLGYKIRKHGIVENAFEDFCENAPETRQIRYRLYINRYNGDYALRIINPSIADREKRIVATIYLSGVRNDNMIEDDLTKSVVHLNKNGYNVEMGSTNVQPFPMSMIVAI